MAFVDFDPLEHLDSAEIVLTGLHSPDLVLNDVDCGDMLFSSVFWGLISIHGESYSEFKVSFNFHRTKTDGYFVEEGYKPGSKFCLLESETADGKPLSEQEKEWLLSSLDCESNTVIVSESGEEKEVTVRFIFEDTFKFTEMNLDYYV